MNVVALTEMNLTDFNALCTKSEGRDKLARLFQYAARFVVGLTSLAPLRAGTPLKEANELAANIMKQLAGARRTHRWCKEFPVVQGILQSLPRNIPTQLPAPSVLVDKALELLQKVTLATFLVIDHVGWLKQVKVLKGGKRAGAGTIQLGLKFFCASNFLGVCFQLKKWREAASTEKDGQSAKRQKCIETALKHAFLVVQTAHLSRLYESHDVLVGLLGMITSSMDVAAQLPDKALKITPDAKAMPR